MPQIINPTDNRFQHQFCATLFTLHTPAGAAGVLLCPASRGLNYLRKDRLHNLETSRWHPVTTPTSDGAECTSILSCVEACAGEDNHKAAWQWELGIQAQVIAAPLPSFQITLVPAM